MSLVRVKDRKIVKNTKTGALLNIDKQAIDDYKAKKAALSGVRQNKQDINILWEKVGEIDQIKSDIAEIKNLLVRIAAK